MKLNTDQIVVNQENVIYFEVEDEHGTHDNLVISYDLANLLLGKKPDEVLKILTEVFDYYNLL
jgi:hypothetical protein